MSRSGFYRSCNAASRGYGFRNEENSRRDTYLLGMILGESAADSQTLPEGGKR